MNRKYLTPLLFLSVFCFVTQMQVWAQEGNRELNQLIDAAISNNMDIQSSRLKSESSKANIKTAFDFDKTSIYFGTDENNLAPNDKQLKIVGIEQAFLFPTVYSAQKSLYKSEWKQDVASLEIAKNKLALSVSLIYQKIVYTQHKEWVYTHLNELYAEFALASKRRYEVGESNYLEKITAEAKSKQILITLEEVTNQKNNLYLELKSLVQSDVNCQIERQTLDILNMPSNNVGKSLQINYLNTVSDTKFSEIKLNNQHWLPNFSIELFSGTNKQLGYYKNGFQIGIAIPLVFNKNIAKNKSLKLQQQSWESARVNRELQMESGYSMKRSELRQYQKTINYYKENGKVLAFEIEKTAQKSFQCGEIDFFQYIQSMENAASIEMDYLDSLLKYNISYLELHYYNF